MSVQDWLLLLGGIGGLVTLVTGQVILIIQAVQNGKKLDTAAARREDIAQAIVNPESPIPPKAP